MAKLPLEGIRVVDLSWVWAGPFTALQLAHLGAEVIKVESTLRPDINRRIAPFAEGRPGLDRGGSFNQWNQGKRSIALDLSNPKAKVIVRELVKKSDVVVENFSAGVLNKMGLGYQQLKQDNPRIVMVSVSGFGQNGPLSRNVAYGATVMALGGLTALTGYRGEEPRSAGLVLPRPQHRDARLFRRTLGVVAPQPHRSGRICRHRAARIDDRRDAGGHNGAGDARGAVAAR